MIVCGEHTYAFIPSISQQIFSIKLKAFFWVLHTNLEKRATRVGELSTNVQKTFFFYWMSLLEGVQISLMYTKKLWNNDILSNWVNSYVFYIEISPFRPSGNICLTLLSTREKCVCMFVYISIIWKCYLHSHFISLSLFLFVITEQKKNGFFPSFVYFSLFASTSKSTQKRIKMKKSSTCNCINKFHLQQVVARIWDFFYLLLEAHIAMYINFSDDEWASEWVSEWRVRKEKEKK